MVSKAKPQRHESQLDVLIGTSTGLVSFPGIDFDIFDLPGPSPTTVDKVNDGDGDE